MPVTQHVRCQPGGGAFVDYIANFNPGIDFTVTPAAVAAVTAIPLAQASVVAGILNGYDLDETNTGRQLSTTSTYGGNLNAVSGTFDRVLFDGEVSCTGVTHMTDCEIVGNFFPYDACLGSTFATTTFNSQWSAPTVGNYGAIGNKENPGVNSDNWSPGGDASAFDFITFDRCLFYGPVKQGAMRLLTGSDCTECLLINRNDTEIMADYGDFYHSVSTTNCGGSPHDIRYTRCALWLSGPATAHCSWQGDNGDLTDVLFDACYFEAIPPDHDNGVAWFMINQNQKTNTHTNIVIKDPWVAPEPWINWGGSVTVAWNPFGGDQLTQSGTAKFYPSGNTGA